MMYKSQYNSLRPDEYDLILLLIMFKTKLVYNELVKLFNKQENSEMGALSHKVLL